MKVRTLLAAGAAAIAGVFSAYGEAVNRTSADALAHRWSFNGDLRDSVDPQRAPAATVGAGVRITGTELKLTGNGRDTGSVVLGAGVLPPKAATIEIWATQDAARKYSRIFDIGHSSEHYFTATWSNETDINTDVMQVLRRSVLFSTANTMAPYSIGVKYHISVTLMPNGDGSTLVKWAKRNAASGALEKSGSAVASNWTPSCICAGNFYIGRSQYTQDSDACATYDEVRIWNGALTDEQLSANAALGPDAMPETVALEEPGATALALRHRWSFNVDGYDSAGGQGASWTGSCRWADDNTALEFTGSGFGKGYGILGQNVMPAGDFTVEVWATQVAAKNWARIFDCGRDSQNYFTATWTQGTDVNKDVVEILKGNVKAMSVGNTMAQYALGTRYHIIVSGRVNGDGSTSLRWQKRNAATGRLEREQQVIVGGWTPADLAGANFFIGRSQYSSDHDANAKYDEVRIWNGALSEETMAESSRLGPDALPSTVTFDVPLRSVKVSEKTDDSVTLAFGSPDGREYTLCLAHGPADCGDEKHKWAAYETVATVAPDQKTLEYEVPAALRDGRHMRFFLVQTTGLACAKELDKVTSTGAQWVNTGIFPNTRTVVDVRFGDVIYEHATAFFGQGFAGNQYLLNQQSNKLYFHAGGVLIGDAPAAGKDYRVVVGDDVGNISLFCEGAEVLKIANNLRASAANSPLAVFGCNTGAFLSKFSLYRMKIGNTGARDPRLQRDFIPALDAAGVAGLYDQAHNLFYKSETATPLVAGAELPQERFGRVVDSTPTFRFLRSVKVAERTAAQATLAFGNPGSEECRLFLAYGAADGGDDKSAWEGFEDMGAVAPSDATRTIDLPETLREGGKFYRFVLVQTNDLPYAAELASLTASRGQTVRTGYIPTPETSVDLRCGDITFANNSAMFAQAWQGYVYLFAMQDNITRFYGAGVNLDFGLAAGTDYRIQVLAGSRTVKMSHGDVVNSYDVGVIAPNPVNDLSVFGTYGVNYGSAYRFDRMTVKDAGLVVRDLLPVVKANGKGALFDRENGVCYSNELEANYDFTHGAELARQGWVLSQTESLSTMAPADAAKPATALWTGGGAAGDLSDPANWLCRNAAGATLAGAVPDSGTVAIVDGTNSFAFAEGATPPWGRIEFASATGRITLAADCDWRALGRVKVAEGATIDLAGHVLHLAVEGFVPEFAVVDGSEGKTGEFHLSVPEGVEQSNGGIIAEDGVALFKEGTGTFFLSGSAQKRIVIEEGAAKYFGGSAIPASVHIEVKSGGTFDFNGMASIPFITIEGDGPDGKGALRNTGADVTNGMMQMSGLSLSGDASVGGAGSLGIINANYTAASLDLAGHTLTIDLPAGKSFWLSNIASSCEGTILVKRGILSPVRALSLSGIDVVLDGDGAEFLQPGQTVYLRDVTVKNGGVFRENSNRTYIRNLNVFDGGNVLGGIAWIYVSSAVTVSNETTDVSIYPPVCNNGTYPKLVKHGAGALHIMNNYTDQRMDGGVEIFGGTVVMDSTANPQYPERAISSQPVPVKIHSGAALDIRKCTSPVVVSALDVEEGGEILHTSANSIVIRGAQTFAKPLPLRFAGVLCVEAPLTFDLSALYSGPDAPAADEPVVLLSAGVLHTGGAGAVRAVGCPEGMDVFMTGGAAVLAKSADGLETRPQIRIWTVGGDYVYGGAYSFRGPLASALSQEGWNVRMTGWRTANANAMCANIDAWKRHCGIQAQALKTSPTRAGLLEGLETFAAAAEYPDFTVFASGDADVADGVADATVLANYKEAVTRIKAALPMTTVVACTVPGGSEALNAAIREWCAGEDEVECVEFASAMTAAQTQAECEAAAALLKAKLTSLATPAGKNSPSSWTKPAVELGAERNVPAEYLAGFTRVRTIEPATTLGYAQNLQAIPYTYAPAMLETGIEKVGYYIELVRRDTGALQALWVDMDAPGPAWADVALPVTHAQRKQKTVTRLHVWSNFGGVSKVPASDDGVEGYIEFNPVNYGGAERAAAGVPAEPWAEAFGFNDTLTETGDHGHGCFQLMRKFAGSTAFPAAEVLFAYNRWGTVDASENAVGMGTLADFGNNGYNTSKTLDWTFAYGAAGSDVCSISGGAYSFFRIDFWVKYSSEPTREDIADCVWTGAADSSFAGLANWSKGGAAPAALSGNLLVRTDQEFSYTGTDPVSLTAATLMVDAAATFPSVGGLHLYSLDVGAAGRLVYDPVKFTFRLTSAPVFAAGAKIALAPEYAQSTKGRFLLMTWDRGAPAMDEAALTALFDAGSARGADPAVWAEALPSGGGRLWLDLDRGAPKKRVNVLCTGDSITHGSDSTYGNWRIGLMKRLAAAGYEPVAKGHRMDQSHDICGAEMPEEWVWHSGIGGQRIATGEGAGTIDAIEALLDQAGDVDFVLCKLGTNDIAGNSLPADIYPVWTDLVWKTLRQKPHAKFIAGAVVDMAHDPVKNARVVQFNDMMKAAAEGGEFPAGRVSFADLYTPCYRYDAAGAYIPGSFYSAADVHPDWPGEDRIASVYCDAILRALAADPAFETGAEEDMPSTTGAENNVPPAFLAGYSRARTLDVAAHNGAYLTAAGGVPYEDFSQSSAPVKDIGRVGYYVELRRRDVGPNKYRGLTRWLWVSMDAFGDRTIETVGVPLNRVYQGKAARLRVATNMPGIEPTSPQENGVDAWIEFWPSSYSLTPNNPGAPAGAYAFDWNDERANNMTGFGSMQVHRFTSGGRNAAQVMFAFNCWTVKDAIPWDIGLGNFAHQSLNSMDWTFSASTADVRETMSANGYEAARIEIWTMPAEDEAETTARWTGAGDGESLSDPANWECRDARGEVLANAVPDSSTTVVIDGATSFSVPEGTKVDWKAVRIGSGSHRATQFAQTGCVSSRVDYNWLTVPLSQYVQHGVGDLSGLNGINTAFLMAYDNLSQLRFDGWVRVDAAQAGTWKIDHYWDDYFGFAIDGRWVVLNNACNTVSAETEVGEGWHRFTIICGDTGGGYGCGSSSLGYEGEYWPMLISINGAPRIPLSARHFEFGSGRDVVTLAADCDWRGLGEVEFSDGAILDLNGHSLKVKGLSAGGYVGAKITSPHAFERVAAPAVLGGAVLWFDASDASTLDLDADGRVKTWRSKTQNGITATAAEQAPVFDDRTWGRPVVDFGSTGSQRDMLYARFSNLRTVFWVMKIENSSRAFLLGDRNGGSGVFNFHRGTAGQWGHSGHARFSNVWEGTREVAWSTEVPDPTKFMVASAVMSLNACSDSFTNDRNILDGRVGGRTGGRQLAELVCFSRVLGDDERRVVTAYLQSKWLGERAPGELRIDVADGERTVNDGVAVCGNVKVVKEGAGSYVAPAGGRYDAGTEVLAGTLAIGAPTLYGTSGIGMTGPVLVEGGAVLDVAGTVEHIYHEVTLAGGTLKNSVFLSNAYSYNHFGSIALTADSCIDIKCGGLVRLDATPAVLDLRGHTLRWIGRGQGGFDYCWMNNTDITAGTLSVDGYLTVFARTGAGVRAPETTLVLEPGGLLAVDQEALVVRDYVSRSFAMGVDYGAKTPNQPPSMPVSGVFRPESAAFWECTLLDGATLDLSAQTGAWHTTGVGGRTVKFAGTEAENARVMVRLGDRKDVVALARSDDPYVVKWTAEPVNTVFAADPAAARRGFRVVREETGLRLVYQGGSVLLLR